MLPERIAKDKFGDHVVMVTGAASGIGRTTAQLFARQGAAALLVDIQEDGLKVVEKEIPRCRIKWHAHIPCVRSHQRSKSQQDY